MFTQGVQGINARWVAYADFCSEGCDGCVYAAIVVQDSVEDVKGSFGLWTIAVGAAC